MIDYRLIEELGAKIRREGRMGKSDSEIWDGLSEHEQEQLRLFQEMAENLFPVSESLEQRRQNDRD